MDQLIFAYGSMMHSGEIRRRCPSARFVARAVFPDRRLHFPRASVLRAGGVAGLEHTPGELAWGVVWSIPTEEVASLDVSEGFRAERRPSRNSYNRKPGTVWVEGRASEALCIDFYDAVPDQSRQRPSVGYLDLILTGARQHQLPRHYLHRIEALRAGLVGCQRTLNSFVS